MYFNLFFLFLNYVSIIGKADCLNDASAGDGYNMRGAPSRQYYASVSVSLRLTLVS